MEEVEIISREFWEGAETGVFAHPDFRDESALLEEKLAGEADLAGHVVFRTSGSAGEAKYVCLSKRALLVSAAGVNRHLRVTRDDRWLRALSLSHVGGFGIHARAFLEGNSVSVFDGKWDPQRFATLCGDEGITLSALVPAQVYDLAHSRVCAPESVRAVVVGGGTLAEATGDAARRLGWPVLQSYGLSEAGSQVATAELGSLGAGGFRNDALPVLDFWETRRNDGGVLELRGDALFTEYVALAEGRLVRDRATGRGDDGWFVTGDRVALEEHNDGEKRVTFKAREGDLVKILGELVSLAELRERLERIAGDTEYGGKVALAALPDARRGVRLVLAATSGVGEDAIAGVMRGFNGEVRGFERIEEAREVPEIPRTEIGKIAYGRLAELLGSEK